MGESLAYECRAFLQAAAAGAATAVLYSLMMAVRRAFGSKAAAAVSAACFWIGFLFVWFYMTFSYTKGYFRAYEFLGLGLGTVITALAFGGFTGFIFDKIIYFFILILKYLLTPARFLYKILLYGKLGRSADKNAQNGTFKSADGNVKGTDNNENSG